MHSIASPATKIAFSFAIAATFAGAKIGTSIADETKVECDAVQKIASLTRSSKLLMSLARDTTKQYCHFFVSAPPPFQIRRGSVEAWYKEAALSPKSRDPKEIVRIVSDLAIVAIPEGNEETVKDVQLRINKNFDLISTCAASLFDKSPFNGKTDSGDVSCAVDKATDEAVLRVAFGTFQSLVVLPRSA